MKKKAEDLTGVHLDWAVAYSAFLPIKVNKQGEHMPGAWVVVNSQGMRIGHAYSPSKRWEQAGPLIDERKISIVHEPSLVYGDEHRWYATHHGQTDLDMDLYKMRGPTPLVAAMRCFVQMELGDEIELPEGLK